MEGDIENEGIEGSPEQTVHETLAEDGEYKRDTHRHDVVKRR